MEEFKQVTMIPDNLHIGKDRRNTIPEDYSDLNSRNNETLKKVYGEEIFDIIKEFTSFKNSTKNSLRNSIEDLDQRYYFFNNEIIRYIKMSSIKLIKAFKINDISDPKEIDEKYKSINIYTKEKINVYKKIINLHKQIFEVIQQNIVILKNFLSVYEYLDKEKPIQEFLNKEFDKIIKGWLFLKVDLEQLDLKSAINNSELSKNYKEYLIKRCQEKNSTMNIIEIDENINDIDKREAGKKRDFDIKVMSENRNRLTKLKMTDVSDIDDYIKKGAKFDSLKCLIMDNSNTRNLNLIKSFPNLNKLKIKYCPSFEVELLKNISTTNLTELYLSKNGLVDFEINNIISNYLVKSQSIKKNLKVLSFACNIITKVDFSLFISQPRDTFFQLKEIYFNNNKIIKFTINHEYFPDLKLIDCSNNNLTYPYFNNLSKIIVLQSGNYFLMNKDLCSDYCFDLKNKLTNNFNYSLKCLNLSYLPTCCSIPFLKGLNIKHTLIINLKKLDLSYNGLTCDSFFSFIGNNTECINLKVLNLRGNEFDDTFFEKYLELGLEKVFTKLRHLHLDSNYIGGESSIKYTDNLEIQRTSKAQYIFKLRLMYNFIEENQNLIKFTITKNPISNLFIVSDEPCSNADNREEYLVKGKDGKIIINCFFSFLIKIRDELLPKKYNINDCSKFDIVFDCFSDVNLHSNSYPYSNNPIIFK